MLWREKGIISPYLSISLPLYSGSPQICASSVDGTGVRRKGQGSRRPTIMCWGGKNPGAELLGWGRGAMRWLTVRWGFLDAGPLTISRICAGWHKSLLSRSGHSSNKPPVFLGQKNKIYNVRKNTHYKNTQKDFKENNLIGLFLSNW